MDQRAKHRHQWRHGLNIYNNKYIQKIITMNNLKGKVALVTGSARALGKVIADGMLHWAETLY